MAPPRLPIDYEQRLVDICLALPDLLRAHAAAWRDLVTRAQVPADWITNRDWRKEPPELLIRSLIGSAANVVPAYDGPRRGWTALGAILQELVALPEVPAADRAWLAALIVRYRLIPLDAPGDPLHPALLAEIARLPPQPPPVWAPSAMPQPPGGASGEC